MNSSEGLEVIREEQATPVLSHAALGPKPSDIKCKKMCTSNCQKEAEANDRITPEEIENMLKENEAKLRAEYDARLEKEMNLVKERFDFIITNEQIRASYMLREAHRERQEKITALQTQLECKNLAGLMYVMCSERRRSKLERLRIIEEYTNYIRALQAILTEGQALILHLSRGYKTAARVDHEWREKMKKVVSEFMAFIYHYAGGTPEMNQYFFDLPRLLKCNAPLVDDPKEDPCEELDQEEEVQKEGEQEKGDAGKSPVEKTWWEDLDTDCRPFVMFGDMAEFKPNQRQEVLKTVKAAKTAPKKWKEYVFNEMFLKAECPNLDAIKDEYPSRLATAPGRWECSESLQREVGGSKTALDNDPTRRVTAQSTDIRGNMGSLLKIITSTNVTPQQPKTTALLGAKDSMEIQSTTRLREKQSSKQPDLTKVVISVGRKRRTSLFSAGHEEEQVEESVAHEAATKEIEEDLSEESISPLGSLHNDSLQVMPTHLLDRRRDRINYEKICPMDKCQRLQVDSFIRSLPPYMRANPYTHFEQTYEEYETCSPEQLEILKERIAAKKTREANVIDENPLAEWTPSVHGVMTQTSELSIDLPPCTCNLPTNSEVSNNGIVFNLEDLIPVKRALESIHKACFFDNHIDFDRFKVIGQQSSTENARKPPKTEFKQKRYQEIKKILKQHPSLLDIFQANTRC